MTFALPHLLWLLALPAALLAWELSRRRRFAAVEHPKILRAEAGLRSVSLYPQDAAPAPLARRRVLLCAGLALGVVALARPQWGRLDEPVFDQSREIVIAIDLSRSMLTPDVKPSRLERAKLLIQSLLDRLRGERVGLIVFSGTAFLQSPPSADYEILREFLPALGPDFLPEGGTNYAQLIDAAIEAFGEGSASDRYLIILSDGEATDDDWRGRVPELAKRGIRVIGLGVGTAGGGMIPDGAGAFMKDERGAVVLSRLESGTLRELATATHGAYRDASSWVDLPALLASTVDAGRRGRFVERNTVRHVERYQWALAQALICLAASFWLEFPVRPRSRAVPLSEPRPQRARAASAASAAVALAVLALLAGAGPLGADEQRDPAASLSKAVGRLSAQDTRSAVDWAEMASDTVSWGQKLGSGGQKVPEGPVRDALEAVDLGQRADAKAADWERLRSELKKLLENPEQKKQDEQQQQNQQQKDQQQQQNRQDQKQQGRPQDQKQNQQQSQQQQGSQPRQQQGTPQEQRQDSQRANAQSAFGSMGGAPTPTPKEEGERAMQRVGGVRKDQQNDPARRDPQLAVPLEKLEQLRNDDSPAELFGLLRKGEPTPTPAGNAKNW